MIRILTNFFTIFLDSFYITLEVIKLPLLYNNSKAYISLLRFIGLSIGSF